MLESGYPAYTTSAGWLGYDDSMVESLVKQAVLDGFRHVKMKVGADLEADDRRAALIRRSMGPNGVLMMDANQAWGVDEAISAMRFLGHHDPWWIEEPTSPDDILGHARIRREIEPIRVATGEHVQNRIIFKQLFQAKAIDVCQLDACRVGGVNEAIAILLLAAKFGVPVCPHAGGVGLCEYVQHLALFDYVASADRSRTGSSNGSIIFTSTSLSLQWCGKGGMSRLELPGTASRSGRNRSLSTPSLTAPSGRTSRPAASPRSEL